MAARSVSINFANKASVALVQTHRKLDHGIWTTLPPARIEAGTSASWESESNGVATGTEGEIDFSIESAPGQIAGKAHFHWDNPFVGSNSYDESVPQPFFKAPRVGGNSDNSEITWTFDETSTAGDGIPDDWKINGATIDNGDGSGSTFIDLHGMGADVNRADIFVQVDWMASGTETHALTPAAIKTVVDAFNQAPYISRNGAIRINLHVDAGPASIMNFATGQLWGTLSRAKQLADVPQLGSVTVDSSGSTTGYDWTEFDKIKNGTNGFTSTRRTPIYIHQLATLGNSGVARGLGSDFIVSLGAFAGITDTNIAGTFMHELGHSLGLDHGGGDGVNNKANYVSVMNYLWQFPGVTRAGTSGIVDYSNAELNSLDETKINESAGLGVAAVGVAISHWLPQRGATPGRFVQVADGSQPIDWDGDGLTTGTGLNLDTNNDGVASILAPFNDWKIIKIKGGSIGAGGEFVPPMLSSIVEMTPADLRLILPADITPPTTHAVVWPKPNPAGWNRTDVEVTFTATDDISGVARTEHRLDGTNTSTGSVRIAAEGLHQVDFNSTDRAQNVEANQSLEVKIDKTAPEVAISYDPHADEIVVTGSDSLSGVDSGSVKPSTRSSTEWTVFGSDVAELRHYLITDHAGNRTDLLLKVRCSPVAYEASIVDIRYDDERNKIEGNRNQANESTFSHHTNRPAIERNTIVFQRLVGRSKDAPLLGAVQIVSIGEGGNRSTVRARYDVLDDLSLIRHEIGQLACADCQDHKPVIASDVRGFVMVQVATRRGQLVVIELHE